MNSKPYLLGATTEYKEGLLCGQCRLGLDGERAILSLNAALLRRLAGATGAALIALLAVGGVGLGAVEILRAPAAPSPAALASLALALGPVVLASGLPLAALVGLVSVLGQWREDGEWLALRAAGWGGRGLLPALALAALAVGAASWGLSHWLEPAARAQLREALRVGVTPAPGRVLELGEVALLADAVEPGGERMLGLFFAYREPGGTLVVGSAAAAELEGESAPALVLERGYLHAPGEPALGVRFETARVPLPRPKRRIELVERSDGELAELVRRTEADGRDASYERSVLYKRSAWPVAGALLLLLAAPLALSGRGWAAAAAVLGYWAAVRGFDHAARSVGALAAAWSPPGLLAAATLAAWAAWRER